MKTPPPEFTCPVCGRWNCNYKYCSQCEYNGSQLCPRDSIRNCECDNGEFYKMARKVPQLQIQLDQKDQEIYYLNEQVKRWRNMWP